MKDFTGYEKFIIAILSFLQFTIVLDFMILSPLGAILMPTLHITPAQFGLVVSVYAFSAGIAGFLAAGFADRYDRKKLLLFFYSGFVLGTFLCGVADTYGFLLVARMVTGLFGGVVGSITFAIVTDLFPLNKRGRVMGFMQTSFAASQILGIPIGLYISNVWGWHAPFFMIVIASFMVGFIILFQLQPINAHLKLHARQNAFHHLIETIATPKYLRAFATMALLATGGFMLMPFGSAFSVHNLGLSLNQLPLVYLVTGLCSIVAGPLIGKASDAIGKFKVFLFGSLVSIAMVLVYTNLGVTPLGWVIAVSVVMFVGIFSRIIPSQALISAIPTPDQRGAFMAVTASIQQISGGLAAALAGWIVSESPNGMIQHFDILGFVVSASICITLVQMFFINREIERSLAQPMKA